LASADPHARTTRTFGEKDRLSSGLTRHESDVFGNGRLLQGWWFIAIRCCVQLIPPRRPRCTALGPSAFWEDHFSLTPGFSLQRSPHRSRMPISSPKERPPS
jgi:hypothetical protein